MVRTGCATAASSLEVTNRISFFFSSRRRHTRLQGDWSSDVCSSDLDEDGAPVCGAAVEIWHCNAAGKYILPNDTHDAPVDPNFYGAARMIANEAGLIELRTIKPGAYPVPGEGRWWRPPHVHFSVWGR